MSNQIDLNNNILTKSTLLYLEDDEVIRKETLSIFEKFFHKVYCGQDGQVGLELYNQNQDEIDIVLTDINMPNMDGISFMEEVRKENTDIPILIITAFNDIDILVKAIKLKVTDYIVKPIQLNTTLKLMNNILQDLENKKMVSKQQHELQIYKDILDKQNLISETDLNGIITYANDIFCEVSGYSYEELVGQNHNIVRHPDASAKIYEHLWETIQAKNVWKGKLKNIAKDGSAYYVKSTVFPILDSNGNIEKYVASRFLITEDEEEKHKLKKYIMQQKTDQMKYEKQIQETFDEAVNAAKMQKDEQVAKFLRELNEQIKMLRAKISDDKGRIIHLEKELKAALERNDDLQQGYQGRLEKLHKTAVVSVEQYTKFKKQNTIIAGKLEKSQEAIKTLQEYIDEYRDKITDLEDVISAYEEKFGHISK